MNRDSEVIIDEYIPRFKEWLTSKECKEFIDERDSRIKRFRELLSPAKIDRLEEYEMKEILTSLWACHTWSNKDKFFQIFLDANDNDIDKIRINLKELIHGNRPLRERYDNFRTNVKRVGSAIITEILAFYDPSRYGLWNDKVRKAAKLLNLSNELYSNKQQIDGEEYEHVVDELKQIKDKFEDKGLGSSYLDVDLFFMYYLSEYNVNVKRRDIEDRGIEHDDIINMLLEIGNNLGFDVKSEEQIAKGSRIDVVWSARISILGSIKYLFKVHVGGSIDSLVLNLQKATSDHTVQKLVVVADKEMLQRVKDEVEPLPCDFKRRLVYMDVNDIIYIREMLENIRQRLSKVL